MMLMTLMMLFGDVVVDGGRQYMAGRASHVRNAATAHSVGPTATP
jgi:hypothetical protein